MPALPLSPQVFSILSALIEERSGLHYSPVDQALFAEKVTPRLEENGFDSFLDYYYFLRYDEGGAQEMTRLIETLVVNETYLFRELEQLRVAVGSLIEPLVRAGRRPRIWSAACASGEEPATLAMLLADRGLLDRCELIASDISAAVLARAREGRFSRRALRSLNPALAEKWLIQRGNEADLSPRLLAAIDFRQINLIDAAAVNAVGKLDVILCRNVLIYFRDELIKQVIERFAHMLVPGGALLVSVSESLLRFGTSLQCEEHGGAFVYRRSAR